MGVTITQSASSASRTGSEQSHEIALMATKKSSLMQMPTTFEHTKMLPTTF